MRGALTVLLTPLCLLLALPVLGVLGAWLAWDAAALAVLRHQLATVLPEYALQSAGLAFFVGLGVMVFSACSHAGIVNVCLDTRRLFPDRPLYAAMGGLHLGGVMEKIIHDTVKGLGQFGLKQLIVGHCTGWRALHALADAYPDIVSQSAVGTTYTLSAESVKVSGR